MRPNRRIWFVQNVTTKVINLSFNGRETRQLGLCRVLACHDCGSDLYLEGERDPSHTQSKAVTRRK
jgi:hypothetical protein